MTEEHRLVFEEAGRQLGHIVKLARNEDDPSMLLALEEIEQLSADGARTLLAAAVLLLAQRRQL